MNGGRALAGVSVLWLALAGCVVDSGERLDRVGLRADTPLPARQGSVVVDGCVLDTWQTATLAAESTRRVLSEVILLCLVPRADGQVAPTDPAARAALARTSTAIGSMGYRVHLGVAFTDETGQRYDGNQTRSLMADAAWRAKVASSLAEFAPMAAGFELDLQGLDDAARSDLTALVAAVSGRVRPDKRLGVFVPPSTTEPSDIRGAEAFDRPALAKLVDRLRVMTLDYSDRGPGPTIDPGWAGTAARLAAAAGAPVDFAYPLYGTDFGPTGARAVTYLEARGLATVVGASVERGPTQAPFFRYTASNGEPHEVWFDDAESTGIGLGALDFQTLPPSVGVVFYGLGAEDPSLFGRLAARMGRP